MSLFCEGKTQLAILPIFPEAFYITVNINNYNDLDMNLYTFNLVLIQVFFQYILNDTSYVTDSVFGIFQKRLEQLNRTFHHRFRI